MNKIMFKELEKGDVRMAIFKLDTCLSVFTVEPDRDNPKNVGCIAEKDLSHQQAIELRDFLNYHYPKGVTNEQNSQ